ncbi:CACTA en-spm transposon protein [Cucumis melo var. makuwa]|uniref:CACTA en-spm transposon protein n=1 Tax=Cucumis melo var. makuwa TaxID=1194695 RepID=A0A5A7V161_CUCMM|nr:CACTA en-spm transposon protein [Cucumis melo var. makuwa]TYK09877.1 CACTA en-spm transposon protein [Cucumis melo var. makuwa]
MLNDLQASIEHEEETEELRLEDEMPMNVGVDIDEDRTNNIFQDLLNEARNELYLGCFEFSSLNFLVKLMLVKVLNDWSNKSFDMLLELLRAAFPMCSTIIPSSFYEAKRKLHDLGLGYETIHACKYDCVLYLKEFTDCDCVCNIVLHVARLDDVLRHPADAEGWKHFDSEFSDFAFDSWNVEYKGVSGYLSVTEEPVILATQVHQVFYVDDPKNEIVVSHQVDGHIEDDTLCRTNVDPTIVERSIVHHITDDFIDDVDEYLSHLERHVAINWRILMTIAPGAKKPISPHAVRFSQAIGMCVQKTFLVHGLKMADVGREYIEVVKGDLRRLFVLDFNDQVMNRFVELQMNNHGRTRLLGRSSLTIIVAGPSRFYNDSTSSLRKGESIDHVELFWEMHVRAGTFVSQAAEDAHNQMLELQSQPTPEGNQPLSGHEICDQVLDRRPGYSKGLGWGPKPKVRRTMSASSSSTSCLQSTQKEIELQAKLNEALERIDVQDRIHQALASQVEQMQKLIKDFTRAQQGPPHYP